MTLAARLEDRKPKPAPQPIPEWRRRALADQAKRGTVAVKEVAA